MPLKSLNQFLRVRALVTWVRNRWLRWKVGVIIHPKASLSLSSRIVPGRRGSIVIGADTLVAFKTLIYSRDPATGEDKPISIGKRCFIGGGAMILPGVEIGDECIVGSGAVVFEKVPPGCIVGGNPARILRRGISVGRFGALPEADENTRRLWPDD